MLYNAQVITIFVVDFRGFHQMIQRADDEAQWSSYFMRNVGEKLYF